MSYISHQKRYSPRTHEIYVSVLESFFRHCLGDSSVCLGEVSQDELLSFLNVNSVRVYQIFLMDERKLSVRTVNLHMSVLSGFCSYLVRQGDIKSNPLSLMSRPKQAKRLPVFFRSDAMQLYLERDNALNRKDFLLDLQTVEEKRDTYEACLRRIIVIILYTTGVRRAELIGLKMKNLDLTRKVMRVRGKGDKMREIPLLDSVIGEISLYLQAATRLVHCNTGTGDSPLLVTFSGEPLYPMLVDRAVKAELGGMGRDFEGRKSPHVLRHSLATGLLQQGAELTSIKEILGHANLAATQVYTHTSARELKKIYEQAHPRAKKSSGQTTNKGGNNGN